mmetsp:Transcript_30434/g.69185  ORF Transcript_30434/g.69185 Transcript_30434/m.69185 type:complete len:206 (-) Transcript_30434:66-683(-)
MAWRSMKSAIAWKLRGNMIGPMTGKSKPWMLRNAVARLCTICISVVFWISPVTVPHTFTMDSTTARGCVMFRVSSPMARGSTKAEVARTFCTFVPSPVFLRQSARSATSSLTLPFAVSVLFRNLATSGMIARMSVSPAVASDTPSMSSFEAPVTLTPRVLPTSFSKTVISWRTARPLTSLLCMSAMTNSSSNKASAEGKTVMLTF